MIWRNLTKVQRSRNDSDRAIIHTVCTGAATRLCMSDTIEGILRMDIDARFVVHYRSRSQALVIHLLMTAHSQVRNRGT